MMMALVACTQEETLNNEFGLKKLKTEVEGYHTSSRVGFTDKDAAFFWTKGDKIGVTTSNSSTFQGMTLSGDGGSATGDFSGSMSGNPSGYAVYPYGQMGRHSVNNDELTYTLPASYTYKTLDATYAKADGNSYNAPMWGKVNNGSVSFKHLSGVIAFEVNGLPENTSGKFILTASNKINGTFTANLKDSEPVITSEATDVPAEKTITISFTTAEGQNKGYFYVPVPTGSLGNLMLAIVDGDENEIASGAWDNITINRKDIKRAVIGEQSITGGMVQEIEGIDEITNEILTSEEEELIVQVTEEVSGTENTIILPQTLQTEVTTFSFASVAEGAAITIQNAADASYSGQIIIEIPENETIPTVTANIPDGEVYIKQGTVTTLVTSSADNTTIIGAKAMIGTLIVQKGNVRIEDGGKVQTIQRQDNQDNVTYVIYESATAPTIELGEGVLLVSAAEFDLLTAVANGGEIVLTSDVVLTTPLVIADGKTVTIDLNGHIISQSKECTASYSMITNKGALTIKDTSSEGDGKITFQDLSNGGGDTWGSYVITNNGTLVVENGTLEHLGTADNNFDTNLPIQNYAGKVTINGGKISSQQFRSVRDFTAGGEIVINGGVFEGQVWMQGLGNGSSSLTINGGEFAPMANDGSSVYITNNTNDIIVTINGGKFNTKIGCADVAKAGIKGSVKGGIFTESAKTNTNNALIAEGCAFVETADGYWEIGKSWEKISETSYTIHSAGGMRWFAEQVNSGQETFAGKTITLAKDIDLNNEEWTPIGTFENSFDGNFDGQNRVIKNLKITSSDKGEVYIGLFGVTANNKIENFTIENVNISSEGQIVATAVAYPYYTDVKNITVQGNVNIKGGNYTAGVIAYTRYCVNASNLSIVGNSGSSIIGAITVGGVIPDIQMNGGIVANYSNFAASGLTISGTNAVGGISGIISGQTLDGASVKNVTLECTGKQVGIISGSMGSSSILKNLTIENVTGTNVVIGGNYDTAQPIEAKISNQYYFLFSEALKNVKNGETITLLSNITLEEGLTISKEQNLTIDLNGKTISQEFAQTAAYAMITNKGTLTIMDSSNDKTGKISYADVKVYSKDNNYASNTIHNEGTLTLKSGTIENVSSDNVMNFGYPHAIDAYQGSITNIEGGTVKSANYDCIRMFCNSTTLATTVNISGGKIINRVSFQNPSSNAAGYGVLNITGGVFTTTDNVNANVRLLNFSTDITKMTAKISGGTFDKGVKTQNYSGTSVALTDWLTIENVTITEIK